MESVVEEIDPNESAQDFAQSLTMAEIAFFEMITGSQFDKASTQDTLTGMIAVAARRLGVELTIDEASELTFDQAKLLLEKAKIEHEKPLSENVQILLDLISGK